MVRPSPSAWVAPLEELETNERADHPARIANPDQWREVFGAAAPKDVFTFQKDEAA